MDFRLNSVIFGYFGYFGSDFRLFTVNFGYFRFFQKKKPKTELNRKPNYFFKIVPNQTELENITEPKTKNVGSVRFGLFGLEQSRRANLKYYLRCVKLVK